MPVPPPIPRSTKKRFVPIWLLALIGIPLLVILLLAYIRYSLHSRTKAHIEAVRASGLPTSGAEVNAWLPAVEPDQNGALVISQAFAHLYSFPDKRSNLVSNTKVIQTNTWSPEVRTLVHQYIQSNTPALALIEDGLKFERFRYPVDYTDGFAALLPHLAQVKRASTIMSLRTALAAKDGLTNEWPQHLELQLRLAESLNGEPTLIGVLVRIACMSIAATTLEHSIQHSPPNAEACRKLQTAFTRAAETNLLPQAFICERAIATPVFRMSFREFQRFANDRDDFEEKFRTSGDPGLIMGLSGFFERDLNFYLETMHKAITLAEQPAPGNLALTNHFDTASEVARKRIYILSAMALPALSKAAVKHAQVQANLRMAATALAIESFRQSRGRLPSDLKELQPDFLETLPIDPFDGQPLRYTLLDPGYRLHSVGPDGTDDGGRSEPTTGARLPPKNQDIPFTVDL